jgi:DNA-binding XRE family transcriptional regulator
MIIPMQIRGARAMLNLTQAQLAVRAGLSPTALNAIERETSDPKSSTMRNIQGALEALGAHFHEDQGLFSISAPESPRAIKDAGQTAKRLDDEKDSVGIPDAIGINQETTVVSEPAAVSAPDAAHEMVPESVPADDGAKAKKKPDRAPETRAKAQITYVSGDERPAKTWGVLRPLAKKALTAHPGWKAIQQAEGLKIALLSRRDEIEPLCRKLGIDIDKL